MTNPVSLRLGKFSRQYRSGVMRRLAVTVLLVLLIALLSLSCGKVTMSPVHSLQLVLSQPDTAEGFIVNQLRLPRVALAFLIGAGLSIAGLLLQNVVRNPLASPDMMGISAGASAAAVLWLAFFGATLSQWLPLAAMAGASLAVALVFLLSWRKGLTPLRLVLTGVGVSALAGAIVTLALVFSPLTTTLSAYVWLTGSVYGATWEKVRLLAAVGLLALPLLIFIARRVVYLQLSEGLATGIGVRLDSTRLLVLLSCVILAGAAIAAGGAMAFVGLVAPQIARLLVRHGFVVQAWLTAFIGAGLIMLADIAARMLLPPADLPAGIFVAAFGAPFFLWLLIKQRA